MRRPPNDFSNHPVETITSPLPRVLCTPWGWGVLRGEGDAQIVDFAAVRNANSRKVEKSSPRPSKRRFGYFGAAAKVTKKLNII